MTAKQENKLSMFLAVKTVCDRSNSTWQTLQAFTDGYADFGTHVTNIQNLAQSQSVDSTGLSADKDQLRKAMAVAAVEVANAVYGARILKGTAGVSPDKFSLCWTSGANDA